MSNDQLSFIYLTDLIIHNVENVRPTRYMYSLLHIDEAMKIYKISVIILQQFNIILYHINVSYNICGKQLKYLKMYLSRLHNIIGTDARNTSAQRVGYDRTGLCEHAPSIQHVNNSELCENVGYESILYFTHHKNTI